VMLTRSMSKLRDQTTARQGEIPCDLELFEVLRSVRKELADGRNVPPYVIFSDVTLRHFSRAYPESESALLTIPGVGEKKRDDFGKPFLVAIRDWLSEHPKQHFSPLEPAVQNPRVEKKPSAFNSSARDSVALLHSGKSVAEIALVRGLSESTIEGHLAQAIEAGEAIEPSRLYTVNEEQEMRNAFKGYEEIALKPVFEQLGQRLSYGKLRLFRAIESRK
jgi:ATP-dependent DNA helicase RecQ